MIKPQQDELLTEAEVAQYLRVDATTVRRWIQRGALETISLPRYGERTIYRVKSSVVEHILTGGK